MAGLRGVAWRIAPSPKYSVPIITGGKIIGTAILPIRWSRFNVCRAPILRVRDHGGTPSAAWKNVVDLAEA